MFTSLSACCARFGKYLSVDDCCMELDPCGLTPCQHIKNCYYKQLLAEQAKNKKLVEALESIKGVVENKSKLFIGQNNIFKQLHDFVIAILNGVNNAK